MNDAPREPLDDPIALGRAVRARVEMLAASGVRHVEVNRKAGALGQLVQKARTDARRTPPKAGVQNQGRGAPSLAGHKRAEGPHAMTGPSLKADAFAGAPATYPNAVIVPSAAAQQLAGYPGERAKKLAAIAREVEKCDRCQLCATRTQTVFSRGDPNSPLMIIGEAPGADEDAQGFPFVGRAGKLLDDILQKGMKYDPGSVYVCNVLKCRPPGNRNPEPLEIERCRGFLERQIEIVDPIVILALGRFPAQWLLDSAKPIGQLRGRMWSVGGRHVVATYHPAYLLRNPSAKADVWKDVQLVMEFFGRDKALPMREST